MFPDSYINSLLLINGYLTMCKSKDPKGQYSKLVQMYLTNKIDKTLSNKIDKTLSNKIVK